ncbi:MAG: hypothetical protein AAGA10_20235 [Bacteroidota bacterium]
MKKKFALLILSAIVPSFVFSQITITSSDVLGLIGKSFIQEEEVSESISITPGPGGADQTWDFTNVVFDSVFTVTTSFINPSDSPFPDSFPEANLVQRIELDTSAVVEPAENILLFSYAKVTEGSFISLGSATTTNILGNDTTLFIRISDTFTFFPLTYQKEWQVIDVDTIDIGNSLLSIIEDSSFSVVDGFGTVQVPAGTFECLRLREESRTLTKTVVNGIEVPGEVDTRITYSWISKDAFLVASMGSFDMEQDLNFTTAASFGRLLSIEGAPVDTTVMDTTMNPVDTTMMDTTVMDTTIIDTTGMDTTVTSQLSLLEVVDNVSLSPNPATGYIQLNFNLPERRELDIEILDLQGRRVDILLRGEQSPGIYLIKWQGESSSGSFVPDGNYILLMRSENRLHSIKFLWQN